MMDMGRIIVLFVLLFLVTSEFFSTSIVYGDNLPTENLWSQKKPMEQERGHVGVAVVDGKIYVIGGNYAIGTEWNAVGTNEQYDPLLDKWFFKATMPVASDDFAIAVWNEKIYCFSPTLNQEYDPKSDTWTNKTAMPTARWSLQANTIGDTIYLVGGQTPGTYTTYTDISLALNEAYDPATDTWTTMASMPYATRAYASAVFNDKLYVFGGLQLNDLQIESLTQIYNPETNSWHLGSSSPIITSYAKAVTTTGVSAPPKIYLFDAGALHLPSAQAYDPVTDTWATGVAQPTSRMSFGTAVVDDLIYAIGGHSFNMTMYPTSTISYTSFSLNEQYTPFGYGLLDTKNQTKQPSLTYSPTPYLPLDRNAPHLDLIFYLIPIAVIFVAIVVSILICRRHRKTD